MRNLAHISTYIQHSAYLDIKSGAGLSTSRQAPLHNTSLKGPPRIINPLTGRLSRQSGVISFMLALESYFNEWEWPSSISILKCINSKSNYNCTLRVTRVPTKESKQKKRNTAKEPSNNQDYWSTLNQNKRNSNYCKKGLRYKTRMAGPFKSSNTILHKQK